jgi:hypothetical protein
MRAEPHGLKSSQIIEEPIVTAGPRLGLEIRLSSVLYLRVGIDALARILAPNISVITDDGTTEGIFEPWPVTIAIDLALSIAIF